MRFELFVASRYLRAKRRQAVIGVITGISIAGVAAGVASLVVALAINNGFRQDLQDRLLGSTSHINLLRVQSDGIKDWRALMDRLSKEPHIVASCSGDLRAGSDLSRTTGSRGGVEGNDPERRKKGQRPAENGKIGSADALEENTDRVEPGHISKSGPGPGGTFDSLATNAGEGARATQTTPSPTDLQGVENRVAAMPPIILGKDMADELGATVGSIVLVTSPQGELTPFGMVPKYDRFRVVGIFNSGFYDYDSSWAFTRLSDAQRLFGLGDLVSVLEFKVDDIYQAEQISRQLEQAAGKGFMATNWMEQNKALFRALRLERLVTFITIGLIVFVAALNILISLTMMVMEKTRDIAVLISMGTRKSQVRRIFIAQGVLIGVVGTAIGLVLGYALSWAGGHYHLLSLAPEVYSIDYVPFAPRAMDGVLVALVAIGISLIATVYPSWSAARILPAEALRYE